MNRRQRYESKLRIDVEKLKQQPMEVPILHTCRTFDLEDKQYEFRDPVTGMLRFQYVRGDVWVRGNIEVWTRTTCVASLQEFDYLCRADVELLFVIKDKLATRRNDEDDPESHLVYPFDGEILNPAEALRECLMIELPVYPHAPEGADALVRNYGRTGPWDEWEAILKEAPPEAEEGEASDSPDSPDSAGSSDWKNRLREIKNLTDKS